MNNSLFCDEEDALQLYHIKKIKLVGKYNYIFFYKKRFDIKIFQMVLTIKALIFKN